MQLVVVLPCMSLKLYIKEPMRELHKALYPRNILWSTSTIRYNARSFQYFSSYFNAQYPSHNWYPPIPWKNGLLKLKTNLGNKVGEGLHLLETYPNNLNNMPLNHILHSNNNNNKNYSFHLINLLRGHLKFLSNPYLTQIIKWLNPLTMLSYHLPNILHFPIDIHNVHLNLGKVINNQTSPIILEQDDEEEPIELNDQVNKPSPIVQTTTLGSSSQPHLSISVPNPPYQEI
jgi:hypothetical protein